MESTKMCGIAAILQLEPRNSTETIGSSLLTILESIKHRGPESRSYKINDHWALGISRLAIIDINNSDNVFSARDSTVYFVVNGEIFN